MTSLPRPVHKAEADERNSKERAFLANPCTLFEREADSMPPRKKIRLSLIVNDIWSGMTNGELMERHSLSQRELDQVLKHLVDSGALSPEQICDRPMTNRAPRFFLPMRLSIYDATDASIKGLVRDISETGVRVASRVPDIARSRTLLIRGLETGEVSSFEFGVTCRWIKAKGEGKKYYVAGFQITQISEEARWDLLRLIELVRARLESGDK
jgi:hypothetical protein